VKIGIEGKTAPLVLFCALSFLLGMSMVWWLVDVDLTKPALAQRTDFLNAFYVAGVIMARGSFHELYPPLEADSQVGFEFAKVAHSLLPYLPASSQPCWQYPPIDAQFLSLFAGLPSSTALLAWQILSVIAIGASVFFVSRFAKVHWAIVSSLFIIFLPFFQTLKFGQQGIILGLFPLCAALHLLGKDRPFIAGLVGSSTFLTLKFLVIAGLISLVLLPIQRRMLFGLAVGCFILVGFMLVTVPFQTCLEWLHNIQLSEKYFFEPHFYHNLSLYISLPALLILHFPIEFRAFGKILFYSLALTILVITMCVQWRIVNSKLPLEQKLRIVFAFAFYLMPVVLPHLLYYDLAGIMVANILLWDVQASYLISQKLRAVAITSTLVIDAYFISFSVLNWSSFHPLIFAAILTLVFFQLLWNAQNLVAQAKQEQ
jgi:hypothetical protein